MTSVKVFVCRTDMSINQMFTMRDGYQLVYNMKDCDIVVFKGGSDISPKLYGELPISGTRFDEYVDRQDQGFFEDAVDKKKKMIGICRGAQFLNVMHEGKLWQDVNNHATGANRLHDCVDLLFDLGSKIPVTSTHHQMMIPSESGVVLGIAHEASSFRCDPSIDRKPPRYDTEVVYYGVHEPTLCVQFHPEYYNNECRRYFFDLVDETLLG